MHAVAAGDAGAGRAVVCTGSYTLTQADLNAGQVANTATADSDQTPPTDATKTVPLPQAPALALTKDGTLDMTVVAPNNRADVGDEVNYTLTASNVGNVTLTGVTVADPKLGTLVCTPAQPAIAGAGRDARVHGQLHADPGRPERRPGRQHGDGDSGQTPPTDTIETVPLPQAPALTLVKNGTLDMTVVAPTAAPTRATRIDYTLTAANVGNVTLTGVTIVDPKLGTLVCTPPQPATLAPGATDRLHGQLHADAGGSEQRCGEQHGDGRQRPDGADADAEHGAVAAGSVVVAGEVGHARPDGRGLRTTAPTSATRSSYTLTATNAGQRDADGRDDRRPEAGHARVHAAAAGDAGAGRAARLHGQLHADAGRPQRRLGRQHGNRGHRSDAAHRRRRRRCRCRRRRR